MLLLEWMRLTQLATTIFMPSLVHWTCHCVSCINADGSATEFAKELKKAARLSFARMHDLNAGTMLLHFWPNV